MPDKQKTRNWRDPKTIIATVAITGVITLWNAFATHDRQETGSMDPLAATPRSASQAKTNDVCPTPTQTENLGKRCVTVTHTRSS